MHFLLVNSSNLTYVSELSNNGVGRVRKRMKKEPLCTHFCHKLARIGSFQVVFHCRGWQRNVPNRAFGARFLLIWSIVFDFFIAVAFAVAWISPPITLTTDRQTVWWFSDRLELVILKIMHDKIVKKQARPGGGSTNVYPTRYQSTSKL